VCLEYLSKMKCNKIEMKFMCEFIDVINHLQSKQEWKLS
jgi:hypothetical protein